MSSGPLRLPRLHNNETEPVSTEIKLGRGTHGWNDVEGKGGAMAVCQDSCTFPDSIL